ncbi:MAG: hypothetical protein K0U86_15370 [Planctomycetes bacterium]|nr:hypothetical protein [Planctomycetota bacterium]MCH9726279.1 hypothetical protein [Planctomycetota bacterium]MCH9776667.1 hypothetical protein [Planctomycetota bacterium]MCH9793145.1 hypothetical protein [Planctomycetota bacterium]
MILKQTLSARFRLSACIPLILMAGVILPLPARGEQNKKAAEETSKAAVSQNDAVQDLIQEVKKNEKLYSDLGLWLTCVYEKFPKPSDVNKQIQTESLISIDLQEKKFRFESITKGRRIISFFLPPKKLTSHEVTGTSEVIAVFDGHTHYRLWLSNYKPDEVGQRPGMRRSGEISDKTPSISSFARPHMFLSASEKSHVPLSTYLEGAKAITAYPGSDADLRKMYFEKQILGTEKFQGLQCIKVKMELVGSNGKPSSRHEIWLAKERNLIPVRRLDYKYRWSKEIPVSESIVDEWKELRPGVWFPMKAHTNRYNFLSKKPIEKRELMWRRQYAVKSITLNPPQRAPDVFNKLEFPKGMPLRVIKNGKGNQLQTQTEKIKNYLDKTRSQE